MNLRPLLALALLALSFQALGNQMFSAPPTKYDVVGQDIYGHDAYEIHALVKNSEKGSKVLKLTIKIYDESFEVPQDMLSGVYNADFGKIKVVNDAGIFGSVFYINIPFAEIGRCRIAKRGGLTKSIYISNQAPMGKQGISARISDPCGK